MDIQIATTPFGAGPMSLDLLAAHYNTGQNSPPNKVVDKWQLYKTLCVAKKLIGVSDRSLAVLSALLSFCPDNDLSAEKCLIVFPSNRQLSLRAHGMPDATLRRHLAALVQARLILRRDSPNGKRYAHKSRGGGVEEAFGFSLSPLLARADEITLAAEAVYLENAALRRTRERITLQRRDIAKLIAVAIDEAMPGRWEVLHRAFRMIVDAIPRRACGDELIRILGDLTDLRCQVDKALTFKDNDTIISGNTAHSERQHTESDTYPLTESEPVSNEIRQYVKTAPGLKPMLPAKGISLGLVLKACPDIEDYAVNDIRNWRDLTITSARVRGYLNISLSAYEEALDVMGKENAAIVIACILQRTTHIHSAGGYLRSLTEKARVGELSIGSVVMANFKSYGTELKLVG